ncbi:MAG: acid-resistance membrane protein [Bacteroidetes bacterium ADurb.Bin028]|nr:MAG: acid-resistance membrane protein [Bacteroidetes bacterium ADurb.Bin028]
MKTFKKMEKNIKRWYLMLIVGIVFIILGIWTIATPLNAYVALSIVFALGFLISGIVELVFALYNKHQNWGWSLALGILTTVVGVLLLIYPEAPMLTLPIYVGLTLLFRSISGMVTAYDMKQYGILDWGTLMVTAILGLIFSFILLWNPVFAGVSVVVWTAVAFVIIGAYTVYFSFKLRKLNKMMKEE